MSQQRSEDELRDFIAGRLDQILEPGLEVQSTEFRLPNYYGAKGFVDILARDQLGLTVVIELKRSDAAARQTLNELHKYTSLLQEAHGLGPAQVRCIVASTDWHELLVPFSSYARTADYAVTGYRLLMDQSGWPTGVQEVEPLPKSSVLELCPSHGIYLFTEPERRDEFVQHLEQAVGKCGVRDYLLLRIDQRPPDARVVYPFGLYFAMAAIDPAQRLQIELDTRVAIDPEEESEGDEWYFEEVLQNEISTLCPAPDDFEIGYPDKFSAHEEKWQVSEILRYGRFASETLRSDEDLIRLVRAESGEHTVRFKDTASPLYTAAWSDMRKKLRVCLLGSGPWEHAAEFFLNEVEGSKPKASVEIAAFNPCDLVMALHKAAAEASLLHFPTMHIIVSDASTTKQVALVGFLEWDGKTCPANLQTVLDAEFEKDLFNYFFRRHFNELWLSEQRIAALHGLSYSLQEVELEDGEPTGIRHRLVIEEEGVTREPLNDASTLTFIDFCNANEEYVRNIAEAFGQTAIGL